MQNWREVEKKLASGFAYAFLFVGQLVDKQGN
jgi:hypothetical protein